MGVHLSSGMGKAFLRCHKHSVAQGTEQAAVESSALHPTSSAPHFHFCAGQVALGRGMGGQGLDGDAQCPTHRKYIVRPRRLQPPYLKTYCSTGIRGHHVQCPHLWKPGQLESECQHPRLTTEAMVEGSCGLEGPSLRSEL